MTLSCPKWDQLKTSMGTGSGNAMIVITKSPVKLMFSSMLREDMFSCRLHARFVLQSVAVARNLKLI